MQVNRHVDNSCARGSGRRGREFKSPPPDKVKLLVTTGFLLVAEERSEARRPQADHIRWRVRLGFVRAVVFEVSRSPGLHGADLGERDLTALAVGGRPLHKSVTTAYLYWRTESTRKALSQASRPRLTVAFVMVG